MHLLHRLLPLALVPCLALSAPVAPPRGRPPAEPPTGPGAVLDADPETLPVPPGRPEDQVLWAGALETSYRLMAEWGAARQLLWEAVGGKLDEALALRAAGERPEARRAAELRRRLAAAYGQVYTAIRAGWGVDVRMGCRAQVIDLDGAMRDAGDAVTPDLQQTRQAVEGCRARARHGAHELHEASEALREAIREVRAFLAPPAEAARAEG